MINRRQSRCSKYVAIVVAYALVLSALLSSLAPPTLGTAGPLDGLSTVICLSSDNAVDQAPGPPANHRHAACCILCMVPGLAATGNEILVSAPDYASSRASPLMPRIAPSAREPSELLPINPRAPPRFA